MTSDNTLLQDMGRFLKHYFQVSAGPEADMPFLHGAAVAILCVSAAAFVLSLGTMVVHTAHFVWTRNDYRRHNLRKKAFKWWAFATFLGGYVLYLMGFYWEGTRSSFVALLFRPFLSSLEMFVSHSDLLEVDESCKENAYYMAAFAAIHFSAVAVSASFAVNCFWKRIVFWVRRKAWTLFPTSRPVNIFFGLNEPTLLLANDLHEESKERMLFIDMPDEGHTTAQRMSFSHIFGLFSYKSEQVRRLAHLQPVLMHSALLPSRLRYDGSDVLDVLELQALRHIVKRASCVRLFFLSDNEEHNLKAMLNVLQDAAFCPSVRSSVYCRAACNRVNKTACNVRQAEVHLLDEAALSITALKMMKRFSVEETVPPFYVAHPIRFVERNTRLGCVESPFEALIVGFGETGREALRFIYEFGAFVGPNGRKSPFRCTAVDRRMKTLKEKAVREIPALSRLEHEVQLVEMETGTADFRKWMQEHIDSLNYVVLALGNDESGIDLAAEICNFALRFRRGGLKNFGLFVRSYRPENELRLRRVAQYYGAMTGETPIVVFGTMKEIYSKKMVVDSGLRQLAKEFYTNYMQVQGASGPSWEERHRRSLEKAHGAFDLLLKRQGLYRKEFQDEENSLHCYTKECLLDKVYLQKKFPTQRDFSFTLDADTMEQSEADCYRCLVNLSIGEHLRWNASHYMMGYLPMPAEEQPDTPSSCNERLKHHKHLVDWDELNEGTKRFDYAVVYTTFRPFFEHAASTHRFLAAPTCADNQ